MAIEHQDMCTIDTVVIGGGQAGLYLSYVLQEAGREHVVLEKKRALEQWRSSRRDSFMMNTPQAYSRIMGQDDGLPDEKMSIPLAQSVDAWDDCVKQRQFPIRDHSEVVSVEQDPDGSLLVTVKSDGEGPTNTGRET